MSDGMLLFRARDSLSATLRKEAVLRDQYFQLSRTSTASVRLLRAASPSVPPTLSVPEVLEGSARVLEVLLAIAACNEAIAECGIETFGDFRVQAIRVVGLAQQVSGLNPLEVIGSNLDFFPAEVRDRVPSDSDRAAPDMQSVVRSSKAVLAGCPIERLEEVAREASLEPVGHRCRRAFDALSALVRRNDASCDRARKIVGQKYAVGSLDLAEAAELLALPVPDAMAFLEDHGYARSLDTIRLSDEERAARYAAIRADRLARKGARPDEAEGLVLRNVIASQRIEGVDARRWARRKES